MVLAAQHLVAHRVVVVRHRHVPDDDLRARRGVRQALDLEDDEDGDAFGGFGPQHAFDFGQLDEPAAPGAHPVDAEPAAEARIYPAPARPRPAEDEPETPVALEPGEPEPAPAPDEDTTPTRPEDQPKPRSGGRRGRPKVPSWDEIVFGAKPE